MLRNWHAQRNRQQLSSVAQNIQLNQPINTWETKRKEREGRIIKWEARWSLQLQITQNAKLRQHHLAVAVAFSMQVHQAFRTVLRHYVGQTATKPTLSWNAARARTTRTSELTSGMLASRPVPALRVNIGHACFTAIARHVPTMRSPWEIISLISR